MSINSLPDGIMITMETNVQQIDDSILEWVMLGSKVKKSVARRFLFHISLFRNLVKSKFKYAIILEPENSHCVFHYHSTSVIENLVNSKPDICLLSNLDGKSKEFSDSSRPVWRNFVLTTTNTINWPISIGYLVSKKWASHVLQLYDKPFYAIPNPIDIDLLFPPKCNIIYPPIIHVMK